MSWNIENILMITIKRLQMNQISALNKPLGETDKQNQLI